MLNRFIDLRGQSFCTWLEIVDDELYAMFGFVVQWRDLSGRSPSLVQPNVIISPEAPSLSSLRCYDRLPARSNRIGDAAPNNRPPPSRSGKSARKQMSGNVESEDSPQWTFGKHSIRSNTAIKGQHSGFEQLAFAAEGIFQKDRVQRYKHRQLGSPISKEIRSSR